MLDAPVDKLVLTLDQRREQRLYGNTRSQGRNDHVFDSLRDYEDLRCMWRILLEVSKGSEGGLLDLGITVEIEGQAG